MTTVPDGLTLVDNLWVEVLLVLTTEVGVELSVKVGLGNKTTMGGDEGAVLRVDEARLLGVLVLTGLLVTRVLLGLLVALEGEPVGLTTIFGRELLALLNDFDVEVPILIVTLGVEDIPT
jgi:hypothetical protein